MLYTLFKSLTSLVPFYICYFPFSNASRINSYHIAPLAFYIGFLIHDTLVPCIENLVILVN